MVRLVRDGTGRGEACGQRPGEKRACVEGLEKRCLLSAAPAGPEFRVNAVTARDQRLPSIGVDADGDFVVAWAGNQSGNFEIYARRFNAAGAGQGEEFRVNATSDIIYTHAVGVGPGGDFVVAWDQFGLIFARRYNAAGVPQGDEFQVSPGPANRDHTPAVAVAADGEFTLVWSRTFDGVFGRRYDAAGVPQGGEFRVSVPPANLAPMRPRIAVRADGGAVVAWQDAREGSEIFARRLAPSGGPTGDVLRVNTHTNGDQNDPALDTDAAGNFIIAWHSYPGQDGSDHGVQARRYDAAGATLGGEFRVNTTTFDSQYHASVAVDDDGDFVVTWDSYLQDTSGHGVYAQRYDAGGAPDGAEFRVNTFTGGDQRISSVGMDGDGDFVVAWESLGQDGAGWEVYAQRYAAFAAPPAVVAADFVYDGGAPHRVRFAFNQDVSASLSAADLRVVRLGDGGGPVAVAEPTHGPASNTATFALGGTGFLPNGNYRATLVAAGVANADGTALAADYMRDFFVLAGDINRDRRVDGSDFAILAGNFGKVGMTYDRGDLNGDGKVDGSDFATLAGNFGKNVAPPAPAVVAAPPVAAGVRASDRQTTRRQRQKEGRRPSPRANGRLDEGLHRPARRQLPSLG